MRRMDGRENFLSVEACGLQEYFVYFKKHTERQAENFPFSRRQHFVQWLLYYFRGFRLRISRASAGVAISRPSSLAIRTTFATSSPLDAAFWPLPR